MKTWVVIMIITVFFSDGTKLDQRQTTLGVFDSRAACETAREQKVREFEMLRFDLPKGAYKVELKSSVCEPR